MKKKLIAYYGDSPVHVEGFPKDCPRSCKGSVHVLPRKPVTVTDAEYEYMRTHYKWMLPKLKVVAELGEEKKKEGASAPSNSPPAKEEKAEKPTSTDGKKSKKIEETEVIKN